MNSNEKLTICYNPWLIYNTESDKSFKGNDKLKITLSEKRTSVIYEYRLED